MEIIMKSSLNHNRQHNRNHKPTQPGPRDAGRRAQRKTLYRSTLLHYRAANPSSTLAKLIVSTAEVSLLHYRAKSPSSNLAKLIFSTTEEADWTTETIVYQIRMHESGCLGQTIAKLTRKQIRPANGPGAC